LEESTHHPTNPSKDRKILIFIVLFAIPLALWGIYNIAVQIDRAERIPQANCRVYDKSETRGTGLYLIKTSCGDYEAIEGMHNYLKVGNEYDMQVTKGNWARGPRLAYAGSCAKPSNNVTPPPPKPIPSPKPTVKPSPVPTFTGGYGENSGVK
jgi:hypothetical protein